MRTTTRICSGLTLGKDSLIVKRSGLARVTAVARGNYDVVNREQTFS